MGTVDVGDHRRYSVALGRQALLEAQGGRAFEDQERSAHTLALFDPPGRRRTVVDVPSGPNTPSMHECRILGILDRFFPVKSQQVSDILLNGGGLVLATGMSTSIMLFGAIARKRSTSLRVGAPHGSGTTPSNVDITPTGDVLGFAEETA